MSHHTLKYCLFAAASLFLAGCSLNPQTSEPTLPPPVINLQTQAQEAMTDRRLGIVSEQKNVVGIFNLGGDSLTNPAITADGVTYFIEPDEVARLSNMAAKDLEGKKLEVRGTLKSRKCKPFDQCTSDEMIRYFSLLESVKIVEE